MPQSLLFRRIFAIFGLSVVLGIAFVLVRISWLSLAPFPASTAASLLETIPRLNNLEIELKQREAEPRMQSVFPEGACFLVTLYGLAWANVAGQTADPLLHHRALAEMDYALSEQTQPATVRPFVDTQVRRGVFWLGQRNYLLLRRLEVSAPDERPAALLDEAHTNSSALADRFLASPTHHLESYPDMTWPADNVTALASLLIHDRLFGTTHSTAYAAWKTWTLAHFDATTSLPVGMLDGRTGGPMEPPRGCANSWEIALLMRDEPSFARQLYADYARVFSLTHFGFRMFREYPDGRGRGGDVDSGPIIWNAGMTATGVGLAAARASGDLRTASDIYNLSELLGWPDRHTHPSGNTYSLLGNQLPIADAFLAWGMSTPANPVTTTPPSTLGQRLLDRALFYLVITLILAGLTWRELRYFKKLFKSHG